MCMFSSGTLKTQGHQCTKGDPNTTCKMRCIALPKGPAVDSLQPTSQPLKQAHTAYL
jgi:hypothetical protein